MHRPRPERVVSTSVHSIYASTDAAIAKVQPQIAYNRFVASLQSAFSAVAPVNPMLRVRTDGLYDAYIKAVPGRKCAGCRKFFDEYGGAVYVNNTTGRVTSALWNGAGIPAEYAEAAEALCELCEIRPVVGVFSTYATHLCDKSFKAGSGHMHMYGPHRLNQDAELYGTFDAVSNCVKHTSLATATIALGVLRTVGGERVKPMLRKVSWLVAHLRRTVNIRDSERRHNLLWYDMAAEQEELFHEGHGALSMLLRNLEDDMRARSALAEFSKDLNRSPRQWP